MLRPVPPAPPPRLLLAAAGVLCVLAACAKTSPPLPSAGTMRHFPIPWENAFPSDVAVDAEGRLWFTDRITHAVGMFDPATETFTRLETPTEKSAPYGMVAAPDGTLWFALSRGGGLGHLDPGEGVIREVPLAGLRLGPNLVAWSEGAVWFTARDERAFGRYDPATGATAVWTGRVPGKPYGIAATPDGQVWIGIYDGSHLYRVDEHQDSFTVIDVRERVRSSLSEERLAQLPPEVRERARWIQRAAGMRRIAAAPDGSLWVAEFGRGRVSGVRPGTGEWWRIATLDQPSEPYGITVDPWGRVWFAEKGNGALVVWDRAGAQRRTLRLPVAGGTVRHMVVDAERARVWLPLSDVGVIALVELGGG
ncbi:MAG: hypothetical protein WEB88_05125 [Gemmatimonadota bacterium]